MLGRRLQILIDEERYRRVEEAAKERRLSVAAVIRDAIDVALPGNLERKRAAGRAILDAEPMPVPGSIEELRVELDDIRSGGL